MIRRGVSIRISKRKVSIEAISSRFVKNQVVPLRTIETTPIVTSDQLTTVQGPPVFHDARATRVVDNLVKEMMETTINEYKMVALLQKPRTLNKIYSITQLRRSIQNDPYVDIEQLIEQLDLRTAAELLRNIHNDVHFSGKTETLSFNSLQQAGYLVTEPRGCAGLTQAMELAVDEYKQAVRDLAGRLQKVERKQLALKLVSQIVKAVVTTTEFVNTEFLTKLLTYFNQLKLTSYANIVYNICLHFEAVKVDDRMYVQMVKFANNITSRSRFFTLNYLTVSPAPRQLSHIAANYNISYENTSVPSSSDKTYKFSALNLVPPGAQLAAEIPPGNQTYAQKLRGKIPSVAYKYIGLLPENAGREAVSETGSDELVMVEFNCPVKTVHYNSLLYLMKGCLRLQKYELMDSIIYNYVLNSYFFSNFENQLEIRTFVGNETPIHHKNLAINNLSGTTSTNLQQIYTVKFLELYFEKVFSTHEVPNLVWAYDLLEALYLKPLYLEVAQKVNQLMVNNRAEFDKKYNSFFSIDDILLSEILKRIRHRESGAPWITVELSAQVLKNFYGAAYHMRAYDLIKRLEDEFKINFDELISPQFRKVSKEKIDTKVKELQFQKANQAWKLGPPSEITPDFFWKS